MLKIDLSGKTAFIAGVADDRGYGFGIAKTLAEAGAKVLIGTWPPLLKIFLNHLEKGKFDEARKLSDGTLLNFDKIYPLDAAFDSMDTVPTSIKENKRYKEFNNYSIDCVAKQIEKDYSHLDIFVHSLANAPEVQKPLLETSRAGYLAAVSASAYSFTSLLSHLGPLMHPGGSALCLSYLAAERAIPGYGGGMSSAKAALESDTRTLSYEAGRKWQIRINTISAGPYRSRAAKAIGFIDQMIDYSLANAPLAKEMQSADVGNAAAFLLSPLAQAITGATLYVDNGLHSMGIASDSRSLAS